MINLEKDRLPNETFMEISGRIKIMPNSSEIDLYRIIRNSVEHFDKLLGDLRKIVFGFDGVIITAVITFYGKEIIKSDSPNTDITHLKLIFVGSILFAIMNILFWALEKHYHRYLVISAKLAENFESRMIKNKTNRLTYQLRQVRNCDFGDTTIPCCIKHWICKISRYVRTIVYTYFQ